MLKAKSKANLIRQISKLMIQAKNLSIAKKFEQALACLDQVIALKPDVAAAWVNKGVCLAYLKRLDESLACSNQALLLCPNHPQALLNRASALFTQKRISEALSAYIEAMNLYPNDINLLTSQAATLHLLGRHPEALDRYRQALALKPDYAEVHSNVVFLLDFIPELGYEELQQERRNFWHMQAEKVAQHIRPHANNRDPDRKLVVGYVSGDYKYHSASFCFGPVLRRHDHEQFRVILYSTTENEDNVTEQFRQMGEWRPVLGLSEGQIAEQIRQDRVDILVDLSGHSSGNRLLVFARKPAPVQVTAWGHGGGTGLKTMDYYFTDPVYTPEWARGWFAETCWDLPCGIGFESPTGLSDPNLLPAATNGYVTFGSLNRFSKVSQGALALWARILNRVPDSKLLLKDHAVGDPGVQEQIIATMADYGVGEHRLILRGGGAHLEHLNTYLDIDVALDPFPQNGGISTWEALWMGVPVITWAGKAPSSRIGAAILTALGVTGWIAEDEEGYLGIAEAVASHLEVLTQFRATSRQGIMGSAAGNPNLYVRAVEQAYREMWQRWLACPK